MEIEIHVFFSISVFISKIINASAIKKNSK